MILTSRHGRLERFSRFAVFITGMVALVAGGGMTLSSFHEKQESTTLQINLELKQQAESWVNQFFSLIEVIRSSANLNTLPYVTHRGLVTLKQGIPDTVESLDFIQNGDAAANQSNLELSELEKQLLASLKQQVIFSDLKLTRSAMGSLENGMLFYVNLKLQPNQATAESDSAALEVILIDPVLALSGFKKSPRVFLMNSSGKVLAHTMDSFVGTDLKKLDLLRDPIETLFLGAQTGYVGRYRSTDGLRNQVAFVRIGTMPFAIGSEKRSPPPVLSSAWIQEFLASGSAKTSLGIMALCLALALAVIAGISVAIGRLARTAEQQKPVFTELANQWAFQKVAEPPPAPKKLQNIKIQKSTADWADQFVEQKIQIQIETKKSEQEAEAIVEAVTDTKNDKSNSGSASFPEQLIERMKKAYTLETIERDLVDLTSKMIQRPVLYFRYHPRSQILGLSAAAGSVKIQNHSLMQAYVRRDIEAQIIGFANQRKVASVTHYGPLAKMIQQQIQNQATTAGGFEAWSVTSDVSVSAAGAQLVGVIVLMQSGFSSADLRPQFSKMIREAGSYLYAQGNKIRSITRKNSEQPNRSRSEGVNVGSSPESSA